MVFVAYCNKALQMLGHSVLPVVSTIYSIKLLTQLDILIFIKWLQAIFLVQSSESVYEMSAQIWIYILWREFRSSWTINAPVRVITYDLFRLTVCISLFDSICKNKIYGKQYTKLHYDLHAEISNVKITIDFNARLLDENMEKAQNGWLFLFRRKI